MVILNERGREISNGLLCTNLIPGVRLSPVTIHHSGHNQARMMSCSKSVSTAFDISGCSQWPHPFICMGRIELSMMVEINVQYDVH